MGIIFISIGFTEPYTSINDGSRDSFQISDKTRNYIGFQVIFFAGNRPPHAALTGEAVFTNLWQKAQLHLLALWVPTHWLHAAPYRGSGIYKPMVKGSIAFTGFMGTDPLAPRREGGIFI